MKHALVVIDVQKYFVKDRALDLPKKIVHHIQSTVYDEVLFTRFRNDPASNFHKILGWTKATASPEIDMHPDLAPILHDDRIFDKITYSAFKCEAFFDFLKRNHITKISICGINIDGCVLATAYEAFDLGYDVALLEDLCSVASPYQDYIDAAKRIIQRNLKRKIME